MGVFTRKERLCLISSIVCQHPNQLYPLAYFCEMFGAAKSTISEDLTMIRESFKALGEGKLQVVVGASGGVRYIPQISNTLYEKYRGEIKEKLCDPARILPGGYIYTADIFLNAEMVDKMAFLLWNLFSEKEPDIILTVETKGIPLALGVSRLYNKPLVVARRESKLTEGSVVTINYLSGSSRRMQTMSIAKRAIKEGQTAMIIDDFIAGGGTVRALLELMGEFGVSVCGCGAAIAMAQPNGKSMDDYQNLFTIQEINEEERRIIID